MTRVGHNGEKPSNPVISKNKYSKGDLSAFDLYIQLSLAGARRSLIVTLKLRMNNFCFRFRFWLGHVGPIWVCFKNLDLVKAYLF